jgi:uncharacterized protein YjiS (DUF1127 family)
MSTVVECHDRRVTADGIHQAGHALDRVERWVSRLVAVIETAVTAWREHRRTIRELGKLDERMLRDIGVDPAAIQASGSAGDLRGIANLLTPPRSANEQRGGYWSEQR